MIDTVRDTGEEAACCKKMSECQTKAGTRMSECFNVIENFSKLENLKIILGTC